MNEKEIRARIEKLEEVKLQYTSWLSHNYNKADSEEFKQNKEYVEQIENEIKQLHEKLRTAEIFPEKKFETEDSKSIPKFLQEICFKWIFSNRCSKRSKRKILWDE